MKSCLTEKQAVDGDNNEESVICLVSEVRRRVLAPFLKADFDPVNRTQFGQVHEGNNKHERRSGGEGNAIHMTTAGSSPHYARLTSKLLVFHVGRSFYMADTEREHEGSSCSKKSVMGLQAMPEG